MNKKAALELSINAIVVLILAITILGLGIVFITGQFKSATDIFKDVDARIRDQLLNQIRESGDLLVFDRTELNVKTGTKDKFYIGVKNTATSAESKSVCYRVGVRCIKALGESNQCSLTGNNVVVGGIIDGQRSGSQDDKWFEVFSEFDINNNEAVVYPIYVQIAKGKPDTYSTELVVAKSVNNRDCAAGDEFTVYQSKQFFVVLT